ncbi:TPA: hypothetical protein DCE37_26675 [Candidatus Latescibacteria bacterium]|nr:hypothetical protein [Candidatus Latescibacterota bacterium]
MGDESPLLNIVKDPLGVKFQVTNLSFSTCIATMATLSFSQMIRSGKTSLSGARFAQENLNVSANNTANLDTDSLAAQRASAIESRGGGVTTIIDTPPHPNGQQSLAEALPRAQNNISLAQETVNRIAAVRTFEANASVIRTQDQLSQSLLDLTA